MEKRDRIIELLTAVRYTTNDIEKVADEICLLFNVVGQSEQLKIEKYNKPLTGQNGTDISDKVGDYIDNF
jgi:hypothetical protein